MSKGKERSELIANTQRFLIELVGELEADNDKGVYQTWKISLGGVVLTVNFDHGGDGPLRCVPDILGTVGPNHDLSIKRYAIIGWCAKHGIDWRHRA